MPTTQTKLIDFGQRSGLKVHPVSMGAMRFPDDQEQATSLIRQGIDAGLVYIDTCRLYGDSELKLAKALKNGYREKVILSSKWCPWNAQGEWVHETSADHAYERILESLKSLGYVD